MRAGDYNDYDGSCNIHHLDNHSDSVYDLDSHSIYNLDNHAVYSFNKHDKFECNEHSDNDCGDDHSKFHHHSDLHCIHPHCYNYRYRHLYNCNHHIHNCNSYQKHQVHHFHIVTCFDEQDYDECNGFSHSDSDNRINHSYQRYNVLDAHLCHDFRQHHYAYGFHHIYGYKCNRYRNNHRHSYWHCHRHRHH